MTASRARAGAAVAVLALCGTGVAAAKAAPQAPSPAPALASPDLSARSLPVASRTRSTSARAALHVTPENGATVTRLVPDGFRPGTGQAVRQAVDGLLPGATGVLLDLRGNGGGRLDEAVATAAAFLPPGPVLGWVDADGRTGRRDVAAPGDTKTPLVVLVDGGTASAAEVVAGALQDRGRAVLVGSRTRGKGTVQAGPRTVARWTTPDGRHVDRTGLHPDVEVVAEQTLSRGLHVLRGLRAGAPSGEDLAP